MKNLKYLNGVLTVIAVCLVLLTMSVIGIIPKANATATPHGFATVPVNADGSVKVHLSDEIIRVNLVQINGLQTFSTDLRPEYALPVRILSDK